MKIDELKFPVVCFSQHLARVMETANVLTTCSKTALRRGGFFEDLRVVDSNGTALKIKGARKLHGVGLFWGYNFFLNQRIKVSLLVDGPPGRMSLLEVKERVFDSFERRGGWSSRGDFEELKQNVKSATTISDLITLLAGHLESRRC
jgi:hypothetical protein